MLVFETVTQLRLGYLQNDLLAQVLKMAVQCLYLKNSISIHLHQDLSKIQFFYSYLLIFWGINYKGCHVGESSKYVNRLRSSPPPAAIPRRRAGARR